VATAISFIRDFNAYAQEDPIKFLESEGYKFTKNYFR
jgi:predicted extracellular nuclease